MSEVTFKGNPITVGGTFLQPGDAAPAFSLVGSDLSDVTLADFGGRTKVLNIFPSVDTGVCAASVRRFNEVAAEHPDVAVLCVSADLPFAQKRFCGAEGLDQVVMLSLMRGREFLSDYGVVQEGGPRWPVSRPARWWSSTVTTTSSTPSWSPRSPRSPTTTARSRP
ncbi:thiol peroxidase [Nonomuraea dietziae]|uniref:thiol peroxidase n=1 Tax=Nonomuraea dietziae TaxID=65515 RepID=UPI0031DC1D16